MKPPPPHDSPGTSRLSIAARQRRSSARPCLQLVQHPCCCNGVSDCSRPSRSVWPEGAALRVARAQPCVRGSPRGLRAARCRRASRRTARRRCLLHGHPANAPVACGSGAACGGGQAYKERRCAMCARLSLPCPLRRSPSLCSPLPRCGHHAPIWWHHAQRDGACGGGGGIAVNPLIVRFIAQRATAESVCSHAPPHPHVAGRTLRA